MALSLLNIPDEGVIISHGKVLTTSSTTIIVAAVGMTRVERNKVLKTVRSKLIRN